MHPSSTDVCVHVYTCVSTGARRDKHNFWMATDPYRHSWCRQPRMALVSLNKYTQTGDQNRLGCVLQRHTYTNTLLQKQKIHKKHPKTHKHTNTNFAPAYGYYLMHLEQIALLVITCWGRGTDGLGQAGHYYRY